MMRNAPAASRIRISFTPWPTVFRASSRPAPDRAAPGRADGLPRAWPPREKRASRRGSCRENRSVWDRTCDQYTKYCIDRQAVRTPPAPSPPALHPLETLRWTPFGRPEKGLPSVTPKRDSLRSPRKGTPFGRVGRPECSTPLCHPERSEGPFGPRRPGVREDSPTRLPVFPALARRRPARAIALARTRTHATPPAPVCHTISSLRNRGARWRSSVVALRRL